MSTKPLNTWPEAEAEGAARALVLAAAHVADAEDTHGGADDAAEGSALPRALAAVVKGAWTQAGVVAEIAQRALDARAQWGDWSALAFAGPEAVAVATQALGRHGADEAEMKVWRAAVRHVARAVACAAGEHDALAEPEKAPGFFARLLGARKAPRPSAANVSGGEAAAIARLLAAAGEESAP